MTPEPFRHQVAELPEIRPEGIEYRLHRLNCPGCGAATRAKLPGDVPRGAFGPRPQAWAGLLSGAYRLSKRQVRRPFADPLGLSISTRMVAKLQRPDGGGVPENPRGRGAPVEVRGVRGRGPGERAPRHGVIWRKPSPGTASEAGSRFAERLRSVMETCRQGGRGVTAYLTACSLAKRSGRPIPSPMI